MLEAMTLLTAAWECVSKEILVDCFKKAGISSESQVQSQCNCDAPFKLLDAKFESFQGSRESSLVDFTVEEYVDAEAQKHILTHVLKAYYSNNSIPLFLLQEKLIPY